MPASETRCLSAAGSVFCQSAIGSKGEPHSSFPSAVISMEGTLTQAGPGHFSSAVTVPLVGESRWPWRAVVLF
jgi:hypothetical protein